MRKGQNDEGRDTFFIQAAASRSAALGVRLSGRSAADLFVYDAIVFGNIEGDFFSRDQLEMTADFVARARRRTAGARRAIVRACRSGGHARSRKCCRSI